ncbi:MAG: nucleotidyltransferase family protein [Sedimentitalea sp.]
MTPSHVMMFCAGFGTRMGALTQDRPKPLIEVAGKTLFDHSLDLVRAIEPDKIVSNLHYMADVMTTHLAPLGVQTNLETPDILETGGGLRAALPLLGKDPVFTTNTDAIWVGPNPFVMLRDHWDPARMDALLICVPRAQCVGHAGGDFEMTPDGRLSRGREFIYGGVQILKTDLLHTVADPAFSLNLIWDQMKAQDRLFGLGYPGRWCDVGTPEGIILAEEMLSV